MSDDLFIKLQEKKQYNTVTRGVIKEVDDTGKIQWLQTTLQSGEVKNQMASFGHVGFHSNPVKDSEATVLSIDGNRSNSVCIATNDKGSKPVLAEGESTVYNSKKPSTKTVWSENEIKHYATFHRFDGDILLDGSMNMTGIIAINGQKVLGNRQAVISPSTGGADDTRAINEMILKFGPTGHGLHG